MTVIAMTREMGTLGKDVAAGLSDALGIEVVHQELVEHHLAERMNVGESTVHRFLEGGAPLWERWKIDSKRMSRYTADEILQLANGGNVLIRGWGAAQLLRDVSHVLCVRICAPMTHRVAAMVERLGVSDAKEIRGEIERNDNTHSRIIQRQFGIDWRDPEIYDIVLNTGFLSVQTCIDHLQALATNPSYQETPQSTVALTDKVIEAEVSKILEEDIVETPFSGGVSVTVSAGNVTLSGVFNGYRNVGGAMERIKQISAVNQVKNNIHYVPTRSGV
jgi:cytidylate kinase